MDTLQAVFILTLVGAVTGAISALAGLAQVAIQWWTLKEIGDLDKTRSDWWEKLEDGENYRGVMRWLRFALGRSSK